MYHQRRATVTTARADIMAVIRLQNSHAAQNLEIDELKAKISTQEAEISARDAEIAELKTQLEVYVAFEAEYIARELAEAAVQEAE